jgi:hypothetical protein
MDSHSMVVAVSSTASIVPNEENLRRSCRRRYLAVEPGGKNSQNVRKSAQPAPFGPSRRPAGFPTPLHEGPVAGIAPTCSASPCSMAAFVRSRCPGAVTPIPGNTPSSATRARPFAPSRGISDLARIVLVASPTDCAARRSSQLSPASGPLHSDAAIGADLCEYA